MNVQTYLFFEGNCHEALELYKSAFGASVECLLTYKDGPPELTPPGWSDKVFHATVKFGDTLINMSDDAHKDRPSFQGFAILAHLDSQEIAEGVFAALQQGGTVQMPLQAVPWSPCYGIVRDKFAITWKIQA